MKLRFTVTRVLLFLSLAGHGVQAQNSPSNLLPQTDNTQPPFMGIYEGLPSQISLVDEYAAWLNRNVMWGHGSQGWQSWEAIANAPWLFRPWSAWVNAVPGRRFVLSLPMLPKEGPDTLAEGATGKYNKYFASLAKNLVQYRLDNSILRLGWEFDGNWYHWKVMTEEDARNFAASWRQIVKTMRSVPGAGKLTFCWNGAGESKKFPLEAAYPGDEYVDFVGRDIYDKTWVKGIYPYPPNATDDQRLECQKKAWEVLLGGKDGLRAWCDFAKAHKKPFMIPEWGLWRTKGQNPVDGQDGHGGLDNPYFIQQMYDFIHDPANNVYEAAYWDSREAKVVPNGGKVSQYPKSAELFHTLFSLPAEK